MTAATTYKVSEATAEAGGPCLGELPLPFDSTQRDLRMHRALARFTNSKAWLRPFETRARHAVPLRGRHQEQRLPGSLNLNQPLQIQRRRSKSYNPSSASWVKLRLSVSTSVKLEESERIPPASPVRIQEEQIASALDSRN